MRIFPSKRTIKRWAIGAAILIAIVLIVNGFMAWLTEHRLQTRIAAIRAAGDPASIADLAPKPIPDDKNAAFQLERIKPQLDAFSKEHARFYDSPLGKAFEQAEDRGDPPTPEQISAIRAILEEYPDVSAGITAAVSHEEYASPLDYSLSSAPFLDAMLKMANAARTPSRFLRWQMQVLVAEGKPSEAVDRGIEMLRLARLRAHEPTLVSFLVSAAMRNMTAEPLYDALAARPIAADKHAALDQELARHDDPQRLVRAFKTERAFGISLSPWEPPWECIKAPRSIRWLYGMIGWPIKSYEFGVLDFYNTQITLLPRPWADVQQQIGHAGQPKHDDFGPLADAIVPAMQASYEADARTLVIVRTLRVFNRLTQFRDVNGREALGLAELELPKEATIDPFSGEPLKLRLTDNGWIVYSVMQNGIDDGGDLIDQKDYGVAPPHYRVTEKHE